MATQIQTWQIVDKKLQMIDTSLADEGRTEAYDLEEWIASNPAIVGQGIAIIGRQVHTRSGPLDLLGVDAEGNLIIVELKRDKLPREALAQAIDYASDVSEWSMDKIGEICAKYTDKSLEDFLSESFPEGNLESVNINDSQRILLVGFAIESALERMINWLSNTYNVDINAVVLNYIKTSSGDELLTKTSIISEEVAERRAKAKKFKIPMSDEPGSYEIEELKSLLMKYFSRTTASVRRIATVLLPTCLSNGVVTRDKLKAALVDAEEAEDLTKAGYYAGLISSQIGIERNDFLRQIISYEYPTYEWEKDNYRIKDEYRGFVEELLTDDVIPKEAVFEQAASDL